MLIYLVKWFASSELTKGKGRVKNNDKTVCFTVICRNSSDAMRCLDYHFKHVYSNPNNLTVDDGTVTLMRCTIDSRGFNANYMLMDGLREPLILSDLKSNILRLDKIFRS